ncbi:hypothetical protein [Gordonia rubripertincta]|uniref:hypothetical protein n=1 Tax=Gordonia rubripertincta TaxID=36822 RepID=UPI0015FA0A69|nr:hypothetical protein [Gordonia rubripertincta]QMU19373.1 hypothetical protein H3V45_14875 [Gordonia rubripertincta]
MMPELNPGDRLRDIPVGQVFSFPESSMPHALFIRNGVGFAVITQEGGLIGYPEGQFQLYEGAVRTHDGDWPIAHTERMKHLPDA